MNSIRFKKNMPSLNLKFWDGHLFIKLKTLGKDALNQNPRLISLLLVVPFLAWILPITSSKNDGDFSPEQVNLALRRTADGLLRASGDSTSRIPAIEQTNGNVWRVRIEQTFDYVQLPALLQASLELHGVHRPYEVAIRRCFDETIDLGYHQLDYVQNKEVACQGREMPTGCHYIEIKFLEKEDKYSLWSATAGILLLILGALGGYWVAYRRKQAPADATPTDTTDWLEFGNSKLDGASQILMCSGLRQTLTFREAKLLKLFASHPNQLLERELILQEVWADEGILVGRSVDVFISRLRKKLAGDPSISIVAVHGVGYRLETGRLG